MRNIIIAIAGIVVGLLITALVNPVGKSLSGVYNISNQNFPAGLTAGNADQVTITSTGITTVAEFTQGGGVATLTDANGGTYTLTESELLNNNVLVFAAGGIGQQVIALTLPATSTMTSLLPNAGDVRTWIYDSSALAAATTTTITAGTGIDLIAYTANDDVIDGAEYAEITCWRKANTNVACITSELLNAD